MTGGQFSEVDLDLLADYVGGALDGTPEETELARLVVDDPAWADAYATLTAGIDAVRLDLAGWAAEPVPMPTQVADRLDAAISRASLPGAVGPAIPSDGDLDPAPDSTGSTEPRSGSDQPAESSGTEPEASGGPDRAGTPRSTGRSRRTAAPTQPGSTGPRPSRGPGRRRRWARRMAAPVLVAVVVAGFAGLTVNRLGFNDTGDSGSAGTSLNSAGDAAERAPALGSGPPRVMVESSPEQLLATGTDYNPNSLPGTVSELAKQATPTAPGVPGGAAETPGIFSGESSAPSVPTPPKTVRSDAPRTDDRLQSVFGLERLADRTVLDACLDAVALAHGQGPVAVELVDYASFRGKAALVVVFTDSSGARWAWVTGPDCGTPAQGADVAYQTRVG